jgi:hypothetical protein
MWIFQIATVLVFGGLIAAPFIFLNLKGTHYGQE